MTETTTTTTTDNDNDTTNPNTSPPSHKPALPVDRDWMKNLILEHNTDNPHNGQALVVAPMVDQSDYPFRLLCRQYGANCAFTPMMNSGLLVRSSSYQAKFIPSLQHSNDRPLMAQLCGHDPDTLEQAARLILPFVDGIDLNCGCPQGIAKRGFYGAFLLEDEETLLKCVRRLTSTLNKPVSVKVRILPQGEEASMELYHKLVNCGVHLLTIHGRTRHQLHVHTGAADWTVIQRAVKELGDKIPIFANGGIGCYQDALDCFKETGVDGVMSSEALLEYPALFAKDLPRIGRVRIAKEYLTLAKQHPPECGNQGSGIKCLKAHVHRFLHPDLESPNGSDHVLRQQVACATDWQELWDTVCGIERKQHDEEHKVEEESLSWYMRHRITVTDTRGNPMTALELKSLSDQGVQKVGVQYLNDDYGDGDEEEEAPEQNVASFFMADGGGDDDGDY